MDGDVKKAADADSRDGVYSWYVLFVLLLVCISNFVDRQIISILAESIKADLGLTDDQLGVLYGTVFAIFFALFGIPLGRLADGWYRGRLISVGLVLWSMMTTASGLATSFAQLAFARMGVGIGEATAVPAAYSLLGDHFSRERKGFILAIYMAGAHVGIGLSLVLGGFVLSSWGTWFPNDTAPMGLAGWQAAFIIAGLPGFVLALWVLTLREPMRGLSEGIPAPVVRPNVWRDFTSELMSIVPPFTLLVVARQPNGLRNNLVIAAAIAGAAYLLIALTGDYVQWLAVSIGLYSIASWVQTVRFRDAPTFALTWGEPYVIGAVIGFGMIVFMTNTAGFWFSPYAMRHFGIPAEAAGAFIGIPGAIASVVGVIGGGKLSDYWKARDPRGRIFTCMLAIVGSALFAVAAFSVTSLELYFVFVACAFLVGNLWLGPAVATLQDLVLPRMRGIAAATSSIGSTMVGYALGPYLSGKVAVLTGSLKIGVLSLFLLAPVALLLLWAVSRKIGTLEATRLERAIAAGEQTSSS
ncbi:MFS transporter [Parasphingopyxis sp.]|uniref:spinster family MFS transporter n=1 Tax=Parasphingopyxis sp. TaxID=1920299 RepID=UPI0032EF0C0F